MPSLTSFHLLHERVSKRQSDQLLETLGDGFDWVALETVLDLNGDEIDDAIVDDGMDGGIDAVCIVDRDVYIATFNYASTFNNSKKAFPQNKLDSMIVTVEKIITRSLDQNDVNTALWDKVQEIWSGFDEGPLYFHFLACSNKNKPDAAAVKRFEDSLGVFHLVDFQYWDLEDIVTEILGKKHQAVNGTLTFIGRSHFTKAEVSLAATVATVAAKDLIDLAKDPLDSEKINEEIFNENVRVDLGLKNAINAGIKDSALSDTNYEFWYLNNGITMVCEKCDYLPGSVSPTAKLTNVQIVNGGQTTRTLFHANSEDPEKLQNVDILVKIIQTDDRSISEKVSESANRQTPVRTRDLHANDWIQRRLEEQFFALGYYYERKRNQHSDQAADKRLDSEEIGQVALAFYLDMSSEAKDKKSMVFGERYSDIFNENTTTADTLLKPFLLYKPLENRKRDIQKKKRKKETVSEEEAFFSLATYHVLNGMKLVAELDNLDLNLESDTQTAMQKTVGLIGEVVVSERKQQGELYTHDRFFKRVSSNETIRSHIRCQGRREIVPAGQSKTMPLNAAV